MFSSLSRKLTTTVLAVTATVTAAIVALYFKQDRFLYLPHTSGAPKDNPPGFRSPKEYGLSFEDVMIPTEDGVLIHAWLLLPPPAASSIERSSTVVLYFHGNAGNIGFRLPNAVEMCRVTDASVLLVDYRGYGKSEGTPSEHGLQLDAEAALRFVTEKKGYDRVAVFGRSLGGAVAIYLAHAFPDRVCAVVVENTFLSVSAMVDVVMPVFAEVPPIKSLLLAMHWRNDERVSALRQPILFVSGDSDELVPPAHMRKLHDLACASLYREFFSVSGGRHGDTWSCAGKEYYDRLTRFFRRQLQQQPTNG